MFRYPGGKLRLMKHIIPHIIQRYGNLTDAVIAEPFVGGGGALINMAERFPSCRFCVNDMNEDIAAFWDWFSKATTKGIEDFLLMVGRTQPTLELYDRIYDWQPYSPIARAFRTFFLNKTSYGGYIGPSLPMGGREQDRWKVDDFWKPATIRKKVGRAYAALSGRIISVSNLDFRAFLQSRRWDFCYSDPPYLKHGRRWYNCDFDSVALEELITVMDRQAAKWCLSINNSPETREIVAGRVIRGISTTYTASSSYRQTIPKSTELIAFREIIRMPLLKRVPVVA